MSASDAADAAEQAVPLRPDTTLREASREFEEIAQRSEDFGSRLTNMDDEDSGNLLTLLALGIGAVIEVVLGFLLVHYSDPSAVCVVGVSRWATIYGAVLLGLSVLSALGLASLACFRVPVMALAISGTILSAVSLAVLSWGSAILFSGNLWFDVMVAPVPGIVPRCAPSLYGPVAIIAIISWITTVLILPLRAFGHSMYGVARSAFGQPAPAAKDDDA